jgi:ribosomal RNA small subunit methyltransferase RsmB
MPKTVNERELILDTLLEITKDGVYSHIALRAVLDKYQYLEKKKRAFITRVVEGTLERMIEIDYIINQFSKTPVKKMKPVIRTIIRSAVYQLKYMDMVPNSAVCNEAVKLAGKRGFSNLRAFVNGVLRNITRNIEEITYPPKQDLISYLSVRYSMPEWIIRQWSAVYEEDVVEKMLAEFLEDAPLSVRVNTNKVSTEELMQRLRSQGIEVTQHAKLPYALWIEKFDSLSKILEFQEGLFYVQDINSMQVAELASPKAGDYVIDICAAPGGKALHMAEILNGTGHVEARDLTEYKIGLIQENIEKSKLNNIEAIQKDATIFDVKSEDKADIVIADLPCSGLGVLRKKSDLKYKMNEEMQKELVLLQRTILRNAAKYVKQGGKLIYSTCTIHTKENEENTQWFLEQFSEYERTSEEQRFPEKYGGDGFYIAVFEKM